MKLKERHTMLKSLLSVCVCVCDMLQSYITQRTVSKTKSQTIYERNEYSTSEQETIQQQQQPVSNWP